MSHEVVAECSTSEEKSDYSTETYLIEFLKKRENNLLDDLVSGLTRLCNWNLPEDEIDELILMRMKQIDFLKK